MSCDIKYAALFQVHMYMETAQSRQQAPRKAIFWKSNHSSWLIVFSSVLCFAHYGAYSPVSSSSPIVRYISPAQLPFCNHLIVDLNTLAPCSFTLNKLLPLYTQNKELTNHNKVASTRSFLLRKSLEFPQCCLIAQQSASF